MGIFSEIILNLGWDKTFWWQLGILLILFFVLKFLLFDKLLYVIEHREEKTSKLAQEAEGIHHTADVLDAQYQNKIDASKDQARLFFKKKREDWAELERKVLHSAEMDIAKDLDEKKAKLEDEFKIKKAEVVGKTKDLSDELVKKLT